MFLATTHLERGEIVGLINIHKFFRLKPIRKTTFSIGALTPPPPPNPTIVPLFQAGTRLSSPPYGNQGAEYAIT